MDTTNYRSRTPTQHLRWAAYSALSGLTAGAVVTLFLAFLDLATRTRLAEPRWLYLLPLAGLAIGLAYHRFGTEAARGHNLVLDEIHDPRRTLPARMTPLVFLASVLTHLCGGSAGREGAAVQMGASLSDQWARFLRVEPEERKILLVCGASAGFAAGVGAPIAGMVFGMEVMYVGRLRLFAWVECLIASFTAIATTHLLHAPHTHYPAVTVPGPGLKLLLASLGFGLVCGLAARAFVAGTHLVEKGIGGFMSTPFLRPAVGGMLLVPLFLAGEGLDRYQGLGIREIQYALLNPTSIWDPLLKAGFTALTVGTGFKGGEFTPLVYIGATLGSALAHLVALPFSLFAALGFAAVFAGAANTPVACTLMAMEIFGWQIAPYALLSCFFSYYASGPIGIYRAQRLGRGKHEHWGALWRLAGELPRRFLGRG